MTANTQPSYQQVKKIAEEMDRNLLATDPRLNGSVHVAHGDGSTFFFNHAFAVKCCRKIPPEKMKTWMTSDLEEWYIVFTEHHGVNIFAADDISFIARCSAIHGSFETLNLE